MCYKIAKEINENECYKKAFNKIYEDISNSNIEIGDIA